MNKSRVDEFVKDRVLVYLKKNKDYGDSFLRALVKFGDVSALVRIDDKVNRLAQLLEYSVRVEVMDEKIEDTLLDLFNYCMMFKAYKDDGARVLLEDLVKNMMEEATRILYRDVNNDLHTSYIYCLLVETLECDRDLAYEIGTRIAKQIEEY